MLKQYIDPVKAQARDIIGSLLDASILPYRKAKDVEIVHFGGVNLAEARQIYLPRGLRPQNITSLEMFADLAQMQRAQGTGVQVVHTEARPYFSEQPKIAADVISLDYTAPMCQDDMEVLEQIRLKQTRNRFLLHVANSVRRDHRSNGLYAINTVARSLDEYLQLNERVEARTELREKLTDGFLGGNKSECKPFAFSSAILTQFSPVYASELLAFLRYLRPSPAMYAWDLESIGRDLREKSGRNVNLRVGTDEEVAAAGMIAAPVISSYVTEAALQTFRPYFKASDDIIGYFIREFISAAGSDRKYYATKAVRYSYTSESGCPMIGDVLLMQRPARLSRAAHALLRAFGYPVGLRNRDIAEANRIIPEFMEAHEEFWNFANGDDRNDPYSAAAIMDRKYLGSSSRPVLSKKRFIQELESGASVEAIKAKYRGWSQKPLAQWQAHFTMGTYHSKSMAEESADDGIEKITREEAIDMIESRIPIEEIHAAWPTSFSLGTLRSFKARVTMRQRRQQSMPQTPIRLMQSADKQQ